MSKYHVFPTGGRQEVRQTGKNCGSIQSMDCLLNLLLDSEKPNKWNKFVEALEANGKCKEH